MILALNPPGEQRVERFGWTYAAGDKVMRVANDYEWKVYSGDLGFIARIDPDQGEVAIDFEGREVAYDVGELDAVVPAYATTVHKAQGSYGISLNRSDPSCRRARRRPQRWN